MSSKIEVGTILMEDRPAITQALELNGGFFSQGWSMLNTVGAPALEFKVGAAGWRCFFLAGEVKATVFGRPAVQNSQKAVRRILAKVRDSNFNCLEVTRITTGTLLGIPYTTVGGHSRHIQQEWLLQGEKERQHEQADSDWARG